MSSITRDFPNLQAHLLSLSDGVASGLIYIEQLAATSGKVVGCPNARRPWLLSVSEQKHLAVSWQPDCKMWACPYCGEKNRRRLVARAYNGASNLMREGQSLAFFTVTAHEKLDAAQSIVVWPKAWKKLHARLKYACPGFAYLAVPELHQDGRMHLHGLMTNPPSLRWLKDNARACGFGYQDDMQEAYSAGVAGYIAKYSAKMLQFSNFPKGTRHYRASQNWPKLPVMENAGNVYTIALDKRQPIGDQLSEWAYDGYDVIIEFSHNFWNMLAGQ